MSENCEITILRKMPSKRNPITIEKNVESKIIRRTLKINKEWRCSKKEKKIYQDKGFWNYQFKITFEKTKNKSNIETSWTKLQQDIVKAGHDAYFNEYPWEVSDGIIPENIPDIRDIPDGVHHILSGDKILTIDDLKEKFPTDLINGTDEQVENHEAFRGIYGRGPQIRSLLSSIWSFIESKGERSNHTILWGLPSCAKTQILLGLVKIFGEGAVLRLDATSTTRAGLEKLIFKTLDVIPPLFICEEIEKADEQALRIWLGGMDDRHEFRKVNNNMCEVRKVHFLSFATANDKEKFDNMMGGRVTNNKHYPGALSSRFVHQLECPRPNVKQMRMILHRDIQRFGGKIEWIEPCLELANVLGTDDPRKILGFLDGGDRLIDKSYQKDQLIIHEVKKDVKDILQSLGENILIKS